MVPPKDFTDHSGICKVEILYAKSVTSIWCRQINCDQRELFLNFHKSLDAYYLKYGSLADTVELQKYYVVLFNHLFVRAKVTKIENQFIHCWLIDFATQKTFHKDKIYELTPLFAAICAEVFECCLIGLEEYSQHEECSKHLQELEAKFVTIRIPEECVELCPVPVIMYNKNMKCINETLPVKCVNNIFLQDTLIEDVRITHMALLVDVYVNIHNRDFKTFRNRKQRLIEKLNRYPPTESSYNKDNYAEKIYFCKLEEDWQRIKILSDPKMIFTKIYFIDIGNSKILDQRSIIILDLQSLDEMLNDFPPMAFRFQLDLLQNYTVEFLFKKMKAFLNKIVLMRVLKCNRGKVPQVQFFREDVGRLAVLSDVLI